MWSSGKQVSECNEKSEMVVFLSWSTDTHTHTEAHSATQFSQHEMCLALQQPHISRCRVHSSRSQRWCPCDHRSGVMWVSRKPTTQVYTKLYSFRFDCKIVSLTAANTNRIFSVSKQRRKIHTNISVYTVMNSICKHICRKKYYAFLVEDNITGFTSISICLPTYTNITTGIKQGLFHKHTLATSKSWASLVHPELQTDICIMWGS